MNRRRGSMYPGQENIPSQEVPNRTPSAPNNNDLSRARKLQPPHPSAPMPMGEQYVITSYDARPINAADFTTYSGTDPRDTGIDPVTGPYVTASAFYTVPQGRTAVVRDWHVLAVALTGINNVGDGSPVLTLQGASNFAVTLTFFVDGVAQLGVTDLTLWALAFGDVFGNAYFVAREDQTIEMRITRLTAPADFEQAILTFGGQLLLSRGDQPEEEPGSVDVVPIRRGV